MIEEHGAGTATAAARSGGERDANARFEALWERTGKERIVLGSEDQGVEIRVDADLSPLALLKRLQTLSEQGHAQGVLGKRAQEALHGVVGEWEQALHGDVPSTIKKRLRSLLAFGRHE